MAPVRWYAALEGSAEGYIHPIWLPHTSRPTDGQRGLYFDMRSASTLVLFPSLVMRCTFASQEHDAPDATETVALEDTAEEAAAVDAHSALPSELNPSKAVDAATAVAEKVEIPASAPPFAKESDGRGPDGLGEALVHPLDMGSAEPAAAAEQAAAAVPETTASPVAVHPAAAQADLSEPTGAFDSVACPSPTHPPPHQTLWGQNLLEAQI